MATHTRNLAVPLDGNGVSQRLFWNISYMTVIFFVEDMHIK